MVVVKKYSEHCQEKFCPQTIDVEHWKKPQQTQQPTQNGTKITRLQQHLEQGAWHWQCNM